MRPAHVCRHHAPGWIPLADRYQAIVFVKRQCAKDHRVDDGEDRRAAPIPSVSTTSAATEKLADERRNRKAALRSFRMVPLPCQAGRFPTDHIQTPGEDPPLVVAG